jgi:hypothetical protein
LFVWDGGLTMSHRLALNSWSSSPSLRVPGIISMNYHTWYAHLTPFLNDLAISVLYAIQVLLKCSHIQEKGKMAAKWPEQGSNQHKDMLFYSSCSWNFPGFVNPDWAKSHPVSPRNSITQVILCNKSLNFRYPKWILLSTMKTKT